MKDKSTLIKEKALSLGIDQIRFVNIENVKKCVPFQKESGCLSSNQRRQLSPEELFPPVKTIISAAFSFQYNWNKVPSSTPGYIARYTTANFYKFLQHKLKALADFIYELRMPNISKKKYYRLSVNSLLNDKLIAYSAGMGPFLRNSLICVNQEGVYFLLGSILISEALDFTSSSLPGPPSSCNNCKLCVQRCPTGALKEDSTLDKNICLQHLSSIADWDFDIFEQYLRPHWNNRFFGCSECTDCCPTNTGGKIKYLAPHHIDGYIGTNYLPDKIADFQKGDFKIKFANNQLSANWIPEIALVRNALFMSYHQNQTEQIASFMKQIDKKGFSENEITILKKFISFL